MRDWPNIRGNLIAQAIWVLGAAVAVVIIALIRSVEPFWIVVAGLVTVAAALVIWREAEERFGANKPHRSPDPNLQKMAEAEKTAPAQPMRGARDPRYELFDASVHLRCAVAEVDLGGLFGAVDRYLVVTIDVANYSHADAEITSVRGKMRIAGSDCNLPPILIDYQLRLPGGGLVRDSWGGPVWHPQIRQPLQAEHAGWVIHQMEAVGGEASLTLDDITFVGLVGSKLWERKLKAQTLLLRGPLTDAAGRRRFARSGIFFNAGLDPHSSPRPILEGP